MGGENCEPNLLEATASGEVDEKRICEECKRESSEGKYGDWGAFQGKWYCTACWDAWDLPRRPVKKDAWTCSVARRESPILLADAEVLKRREQSRLKLREEISARLRSRAEAEGVTEVPDLAQQEEADEAAVHLAAQRRWQLQCQSPGCIFRIHSDERVGDFCCFKCNKTAGKSHGHRCQRRVMKKEVSPETQEVYAGDEASSSSEDEEAATVVQSASARAMRRADTSPDPLEAARAEAERLAAQEPAAVPDGPPLVQAAAKGDLRKVMKLLRDKANPNVRDNLGEPVLMKAAMRGTTDIVAKLLIGKANAWLKSTAGQTADDVAGNTAVKTLLKLSKWEKTDSTTEEAALLSLSLNIRKEFAEEFRLQNVSSSEAVMSSDGTADFVSISIRQREAPLVQAVRDGDLQAVWDLLRGGAEPNTRDVLGETPLFEAVASGCIDVVAALLLHGARPSLANPNGRTAYTMTTDSTMKALLSIFQDESDASEHTVRVALSGLPVSNKIQMNIRQDIARHFSSPDEQLTVQDFTDGEGLEEPGPAAQRDPLFDAVRVGDLERVLVLLADFSDANVRDNMDATPLFEAVASTSSGSNDIVAALLLRKADPLAKRRDGKTCEMIAGRNSARALLQLFSSSHTGRDYHQLLGIALDGLIVFRKEVAAFLRNTQPHGVEEETALMLAVREADVQEVASLMAAGADPNVLDVVGETPLFEAAAGGNADLVAALLLGGADPLIVSPDGRKADSMAGSPAVQALLQIFQNEGRVPSEVKRAAVAELKMCRQEVVERFDLVSEHLGTTSEQRKSEAPLVDIPESETLLAQAVRGGDLQRVLSLLGTGADPNVCDFLGETPLFEAAASGTPDMVYVLLAAKANPNLKSPAGHTAREMVENDAIDNLFSLFEENWLLASRPPALSSVSEGTLRDVERLVAGGWSFGAGEGEKNTQAMADERLTKAVCCDELETAKRLLKDERADANSINYISGETQLFEALTSCSLDMVALLLLHGADPQKSSTGGKPLQQACDSNYITLLKLFQDDEEIDAADIEKMLKQIKDSFVYGLLRADLANIGFEHLAG